MTTFPHHNLVGWTVGAKRWPYHGAHPGCWGTPWKGEVLAINDVRAWSDRLAFGRGTPSQEAVDDHVRVCISRGFMHDRVPVLWSFDEPTVHWEQVVNLVDYDTDLAEWGRERDIALDEFRHRLLSRAA